jgi:fumarate reductase subunit C
MGMKSTKLALLYGFLLWLIPFIVAFFVFPLRETERPLFETIMAVTVTVAVVILSILYFGKMDGGYLKEGIRIGILWFVISIVIDLFMFMWGPMKMSFLNYMYDIGFTYLIYPTVTIGFGYLLQRKP